MFKKEMAIHVVLNENELVGEAARTLKEKYGVKIVRWTLNPDNTADIIVMASLVQFAKIVKGATSVGI